MVKVKFSLRSAGYCEAKQSHALRGTKKKDIKFYATYGHMEHPVHGHILFDTGYTRRFYELTERLPFSIYAKCTKVYISKEEEAKSVLTNAGINPKEVKYIIISHFHADHIGGLRDFPQATFISSELAFLDIKDRKGISALKRGFIPKLLPDDFEQRLRLISFSENYIEHQILGKMIDLFGDKSILLTELDGHAKGQVGALINTEELNQVFLISDAAWLTENYQKLHLPSPIVRLFFSSWTAFKTNLNNIHKYHKAHPEVIIIPCHCEKTFKKFRS